MTKFVQPMLAAMASGLMLLSSAFADEVLIQNALVYPVSGPAIENGDVLFGDGVIKAVGVDLTASSHARVIDASGKVVTPGFMTSYSQMGLYEIGADAYSNDSSASDDFTFSASLRAVDALHPDATVFKSTRIAGVTRAVVAPDGGRRPFFGSGAAVQLNGVDELATKENIALFASFAGGEGAAGGSRMGELALYREIFEDAQEYAANAQRYLGGDGRELALPFRDLAALAPVLRREVPLVVSVDGASDILSVIELASEFKLSIVILGGGEAWRVADQLAAANIPVLLDPTVNLPDTIDILGATLGNAKKLNDAGVKIALYYDTYNARLLPQMAGNAVAHGLPYDVALKAVTQYPAEIFGIDDRYGTLERGMEADIVIWNGDPFELSSRPEAVFIKGVEVPLESRATKLRDRYRDITRGDLPLSYGPE